MHAGGAAAGAFKPCEMLAADLQHWRTEGCMEGFGVEQRQTGADVAVVGDRDNGGVRGRVPRIFKGACTGHGVVGGRAQDRDLAGFCAKRRVEAVWALTTVEQRHAVYAAAVGEGERRGGRRSASERKRLDACIVSEGRRRVAEPEAGGPICVGARPVDAEGVPARDARCDSALCMRCFAHRPAPSADQERGERDRTPQKLTPGIHQ